MGAHRWLSPVVQPHAEHGHERDRSCLPDRGGDPLRGRRAGEPSVSGRRLVAPAGHGVDRSRALSFTFDDVAYGGLAGDTLASALLANGVDVVARSPLLGRPRGIVSAGVEEPSAFVEVTKPSFRPIVPATTVALVQDLVASGRPGVGRLGADDTDAPSAAHRHVHVETLVVGAGLAGLEAATRAAERGDRVMLVDERPWLGGSATPDDDRRRRARPGVDRHGGRSARERLRGDGVDRGHGTRRLRRRLRGRGRALDTDRAGASRAGASGRARHRFPRAADRRSRATTCPA